MKEVWVPIKGFEGYYEVSHKGRIKSLERICEGSYNGSTNRYCHSRTVPEKIRTPGVNPRSGHLNILLSKNSKNYCRLVHRLVAEAFIPNPHNKPEVNHDNGIKSDCHVGNLYWVTKKENMDHANENNLMARGSKVGNSKLDEEMVADIKQQIINGDKLARIAYKYKVCSRTIRKIKQDTTWRHVPWPEKKKTPIELEK